MDWLGIDTTTQDDCVSHACNSKPDHRQTLLHKLGLERTTDDNHVYILWNLSVFKDFYAKSSRLWNVGNVGRLIPTRGKSGDVSPRDDGYNRNQQSPPSAGSRFLSL
jgi:hypothetical protein